MLEYNLFGELDSAAFYKSKTIPEGRVSYHDYAKPMLLHMIAMSCQWLYSNRLNVAMAAAFMQRVCTTFMLPNEMVSSSWSAIHWQRKIT